MCQPEMRPSNHHAIALTVGMAWDSLRSSGGKAHSPASELTATRNGQATPGGGPRRRPTTRQQVEERPWATAPTTHERRALRAATQEGAATLLGESAGPEISHTIPGRANCKTEALVVLAGNGPTVDCPATCFPAPRSQQSSRQRCGEYAIGISRRAPACRKVAEELVPHGPLAGCHNGTSRPCARPVGAARTPFAASHAGE